MNISKRLLTVLMCVAMVVSMLSSFGYALGGATGSAVTDAIDDSVAVKGEPLTGTAISNGANPTTNVAAPVIDNEKTLVFDPAATEASTGNYNLAENFTDMSTGLAVPGSESWTAVYGVNLFSDWHTLYKAKPDNATILVVNGVTTMYSFRNDSDTNVYTTKNFSVYSPYFNVMPYTTGSALDGSDWAANPNWAGPNVTWPGNNFEVGEWNIYGFKLNNYLNTLKTLGGGDAMQLRLTNCAWDLSGAGSQGFLYLDKDDKHTALNTTGSELVMKNVHFYGHKAGARFIWGPQAQTVLFDGCFFDGISGESNYWMKAPSGGPAGTSVTFTNSNFQNVSTLFWIWQLNAATNVSFTKNIFNNSQMTRTGTGHGNPACGILGSIYSAGDFEISNNRFFSTDADRPLFTGYTAGTRVFTITGNYFGQGVNPTLDFVAASQTAKAGSVCKYNYSVTGNPVVSNRTAGFSADSFVDYLDAGMTKTAESLYPTSVTATKGTLSIDMGARKIGWLVTDGVLDLTALSVTLAAGTTGSWETTPTDFGTYTYNITDGVYSTFFTVEITKPENLFSDVYVSDGIITKDAILLDSASESTATGMIYSAAWDGNTYNFIKGTNAFATVKEYEAWAKANGTSGHQIICRTKPLKGIAATQTNHLYLEVPAKYYSLNYKTPLLTHNADGTKTYTAWSSNTWTYDGFGFPNNPSYGAFDPAAGTYELHGFAQTKWELYYQKINNINLVLENCAITIDTYQKLYGTQEGDYIDLWDGDTGAMVFENCYINRTGSGTTRWFNGGQAANFAIRNCFWNDTSTAAESSTPYIKQYSKNVTVDISDNYFKNYHGFWYFEGNNRKNGVSYAEASEREFIFNNNVFDNSRLYGSYGVVNATPDGYNKITAVGNKVLSTGLDTAVPLIGFADYSSSSNTGPNEVPLEIKIEDNYMINGKDITIRAGRIMADESKLSIKNNYVTRDGKAVGLYEANGKVPAGNYWLNPEMTVSNTAVVIESVSANDGGETVLDNKTYEIFYNLASTESTLNDLVVNVPDGATVTFHTDAACETEAIADLTNIAGGEKVYLKSAVPEGYLIYSVTLVSAEKYLFEENYVDYSDFGIDATNAYLITDEVAGLPNGAIVNLEWKGEAFDFEVGRTVFANQAVFHQYVVDNEIENPDVLVKTMKENLIVNYPSRWFTQNFDINPVVKDYETVEEAISSGVPGDGWAFNEEWNSEYDAGIAFDNLIVGRTDALGRSEAVAGDYLFAGFKLRYTFVNDSTDTDTNIEVWNTYFATNNWGGNSTTEVVTSSGNALFSFGKSGNVGTTKVTNVYVKPNGQYKPSGGLFTGHAGKELTVDNMFTDATPVVYNGKASATIRAIDGGVLTIKNSFFKNYSINNQSFAGNNGSAITEGVTSEFVFENNILINSMFQGQYNGALSFQPDTLTSVKIAGNYIDNRDKAAWGNSTSYNGTQLVGTNGGVAATPSPVVAQVYDNYLIGLHSNTGTWGGRLYDEEQSYISNNFATFDKTPGKDIYEMEGTYFSYYTDNKASVIPVLDWKLDANGDATSNQLVAGATFDGADISAGETVDYGVELTTEKINLRDLFVSEGNYIDVYSDPSCAPEFDLSMSNLVVPAAGGTFYVKIAPIIYSVNPDIDPSTADEPMIITLNITKDEGFAIKNEGLGVGALAKEGAEKDFYWLSWRGSVFIAGETVEGDSGHRAGIIYYSSESSLNTFEEKLNEAAMNFTSADDIDAALESINAEIRATDTTIIGYALDKNKTLVWDSVTQSYGYRYNFAVEEGNIRGAKCYVVYYNADTEAYEVMISDQVVQKVPAPEVAA